MLYFGPNDVSFTLKRRFVSPQTLRHYCSHFGKKVILLAVFLVPQLFYNILICGDITDYVYLCAKFLVIMDNTKCLNRLRVVLADKQITNKWVAGEMGVNEMTVSRWRTNKVQPSVAHLVEIARLLKVDIKDLIEADFDYEIEE